MKAQFYAIFFKGESTPCTISDANGQPFRDCLSAHEYLDGLVERNGTDIEDEVEVRLWQERDATVQFTDAPADYDGFGTITLEEVDGMRKVLIINEHLNWQRMRYWSGLHQVLDQAGNTRPKSPFARKF
jgi:hypothetical protein